MQALLSSFRARTSDEIAALTAVPPTEAASTPNPLLNPPPSSFRANPPPSAPASTIVAQRPEPRSRSRQNSPGILRSFVARFTGGRPRARGIPTGVAESEGELQSPTLVSALLERTVSDASETGGQIELPLSPPRGSANGYFASGRPVEERESSAGQGEIGGQESVVDISDGQRDPALVDRLTRLRAAIAAHQRQEATGGELPSRKSGGASGWGTLAGLPERVDSSNGDARQRDFKEKEGVDPGDVV